MSSPRREFLKDTSRLATGAFIIGMRMRHFSLLLIVISTLNAYSQISYRNTGYPKSNLIETLIWTDSVYRYPGTNSDMHWWTWGIDDHIYIVDDDGKNFEGPAYLAHVLKISGNPPRHTVETITDFEGYDFRALIPDKLLRRYVNGIIAVDSALYITIYDYDWNIPGHVFNYDTLAKRIKEYDPWHDLSPELSIHMGFIDQYSKLYGVAGIIVSKDGGKTWTNIPGPADPPFLGPRFGGMAFLTFGPGNTETPASLYPYVYAVSNDNNWESGDNVYLARVHRDSILSRKAWQFFSGTSRNKIPYWSLDENKSKPIFTDAGHVSHPTITYNKKLSRFFLCISSDAIPHKENATAEERKKWDWQTELQLYEGETPWGPWFIFHNEKPWGGVNHTSYLPQLPSKWISANGLFGTIMFAGDYTNRKGDYYGLMTQQYKLILKDYSKKK